MQCGIPNICLLVIGAGSSVGSAQFLWENVFTLGEQQYFVWDNAFQTKKHMLKISVGCPFVIFCYACGHRIKFNH